MSDTHAQSAAFVRREMVPPAAPPPGEVGPLRWVRENLMSSWFNAILTVVSLYLIFMILSDILPWTLNGIWNAGSLSECREIRNARELESAACWAVINERWLQLLFGFYPTDDRLLASWFYAEELAAAGGMEAVFGLAADSTARIEFVGEMKRSLGNLTLFFFGYWRPLLALVLLVVAVAPVLYGSLPRKMLLFFAGLSLHRGVPALGRLGLGAGDGCSGSRGRHPGRTRRGRPVGDAHRAAVGDRGVSLHLLQPARHHRRTGTVPDPAPCGGYAGSDHAHRPARNRLGRFRRVSCWPSSSAPRGSFCPCRSGSFWPLGGNPTCR